MRLTKGLLFTDIHWGRKQNSSSHNQHCDSFIDFVCTNAKTHKIDHIIFMGDWYENRNAINVSTINYAYAGARKLNDLNIPIYFLVGNHDMYTKVNRDVYATIDYNEFSNFNVIDQPVIATEIGSGVLLCPFLFHSEYGELKKYDVEYVYGHFEFNGFVVTGDNVKFTGGPDHTEYTRFKRIFSGHFHKRQKSGNMIYIGNTFPMDFSDANDFDRGFAIHDHKTDSVEYYNWEDCPKYISTTLSEIVNETVKIPHGANIKCVADININYSDMMEVKNTISDVYELSSITILEPPTVFDVGEIDEIEDTKSVNIDEAIIGMLRNIDSPSIENEKLVKIYMSLNSGSIQ